MKTIIVTDSACDLSREYIEENNIAVIPFPYQLNGKEYYDDLGKSLSYKDFYNELRKGELSTTSQITAFVFEQEFKKYLNQGYSVLYIGFSSTLSQTFNNALLAKKMILEENPEADLDVIDSLSASIGQGLIVYYASEMLKEGKTKEEIINWIEENKLKVSHWFIIDNLEHLKRGGRISAAAATIGTLLEVKPLLNVDDKGKINIVKKLRGRKKAIKSLLELMKSKIIDPENQRIFINHGDCLEDAEYLRDLVLKEVKVKDVEINYVGPIIGTHTGPDMLCMVYIGDNRNL